MKSLSRLLLIVLVLVFSVADAEEVAKVSQPASKHQSNSNKEAKTNQPPQPIVITVTEAKKTPEQIAEERAEKAEQSQLQRESINTNKELARYTLVALFISLGVGLVAIVQAFFSNRAANAAKRSADVAEKALFFADRPILECEAYGGVEPADGLRILDEGETQRLVVFRAGATVRNSGRSPAIIEAFEIGFIQQYGFTNPLDWVHLPNAQTVYLRLASGKAMDLTDPHEGRIPAQATINIDQRIRLLLRTTSPILFGKIWYRSLHDRRYVHSFQFIKRPSNAGMHEGWQHHGTAEENYDREITT